MNQDDINFLMKLYSNPSFQKSFGDFYTKAQVDGLEEAKKFWKLSPEKKAFDFDTSKVFEQMLEFYSGMGVVSRGKYDEVTCENEKLKRENDVLKDTIKQMNVKVFTEEGKKIQDSWKEVVEKQMEANKEMSESFFNLFKSEKKS